MDFLKMKAELLQVFRTDYNYKSSNILKEVKSNGKIIIKIMKGMVSNEKKH